MGLRAGISLPTSPPKPTFSVFGSRSSRAPTEDRVVAATSLKGLPEIIAPSSDARIFGQLLRQLLGGAKSDDFQHVLRPAPAKAASDAVNQAQRRLSASRAERSRRQATGLAHVFSGLLGSRIAQIFARLLGQSLQLGDDLRMLGRHVLGLA